MFNSLITYFILDEGLNLLFSKVFCAVAPLPTSKNEIESDLNVMIDFISSYADREDTLPYMRDFIWNALVSCSGYRYEGNYRMELDIIQMTLHEIESYENSIYN